MTNSIKEIIETLERLKKEIEWDYSMEYQLVIDKVIRLLKRIDMG